MTLFLTSSPCIGWAGDLNPANGFLDELRATLPHPLHCLLITSAPDDKEMTDRMAWDMREIFARAGLAFDKYEVLDSRTQRYAMRRLRTCFSKKYIFELGSADLMVLSWASVLVP